MPDSDDCAEFYSDTGQSVLSMRPISREGDQLVMVGKLMGAWESTIYIPPESVVKTIGKLLKPAVIGYIFSLPFLLRKQNKEK